MIVNKRRPNKRRSLLQERAITKELRKQLFIKKSILETEKEFRKYPVTWEYVNHCNECNGQGCDKCNQTGIRKIDVTDTIKLKPPPARPINVDCRSGNYPKTSIKQFLKALFK